MILNQRCKIYRAKITKNQYKQSVKTWTLVKDKVPCNIQAQIRITAVGTAQTDTGLETRNDYLGVFYKDVDLKTNDKIEWSGIDLYVKVPNPIYAGGSKPHHIEALLGLSET